MHSRHPLWLDVLRSPNADSQAFREVLETKGLRVETRLETELEGHIEDGTARAVALIAHAGDGKSHFVTGLEGFCSYGAGSVRAAEWWRSGRHVLNDPSQLAKQEVAEFLVVAFGVRHEDPSARFVAAINRGLLREVLPFVAAHTGHGEAAKCAADWLGLALRLDETSHRPDDRSRVAVPLDRRVLVPTPAAADRDGRSLAEQAAFKVFEALRLDLQDVPAWEPTTWARWAAVALALAEAAGHHVTFREALAHAAAIGVGLASEPSEPFPPLALRALFADEACAPSLARLVTRLRRIDPARAPHPALDVVSTRAEARDAAVRRESWQRLVSFFDGTRELDVELPQRYAVPFLHLCRALGALAGSHIETRRQVQHVLRGAGNGRHLQRLEQGLGDLGVARVEVEATGNGGKHVFAGLARIAWGSERSAMAEAVMPLTTAVQPGSAHARDGWRVLRAAVSIDKAAFVAAARDLGPYVETGLTLPSLVMEGPHDVGASPPLRLDLELFEQLARIGEGPHATRRDLGVRQEQVLAWLDTVVTAWHDALTESRTGFVVFQTLVGGGEQKDPVALRPPRTGPSLTKLTDRAPPTAAIGDVLKACWPFRASDGTATLALTPSACASALLHWAGFVPDELEGRRAEPKAHPALHEALGASSVRNVRQRTAFLSPAFPWSGYALGLATQSGRVATHTRWCALAPTVGAACAAALGLAGVDSRRWHAVLRATWARDETDFDQHPSSLLAHQWLDAGLAGAQLAEHARSVAVPTSDDLRTRVVGSLLRDDRRLPFSAQERWWLLGTWAAWCLMLEGLRTVHCLDAMPLLIPHVGAGDRGEYERAHRRCFHPTPLKEAQGDLELLDAVCALGQASGFLSPSSALRNFDLALHGSVLDVVQLAARQVYLDTEGRPTERTVRALQHELLRAGLYVQRGELAVRGRLPAGALLGEAPVSPAFDEGLRRALLGLGLLDEASDGATLIHAPWNEDRRHDHAL